MATKPKTFLQRIQAHMHEHHGMADWHPGVVLAELAVKSLRPDNGIGPSTDVKLSPKDAASALSIVLRVCEPGLRSIEFANNPENQSNAAEQAKALLLSMAEPRDDSEPKPARKPKPRAQHRREAKEAKEKESKIH